MTEAKRLFTAASTAPLLQLENLGKSFRVGGGVFSGLWRKGEQAARNTLRAVDGVSFDIRRREIFGLVGESGSGKSVTSQLVTRLLEPDQGCIRFHGEDVTAMRGATLRAFRRKVQIVFQNPYDSLNPRLTVARAVAEPLVVHGLRDRHRCQDIIQRTLENVGLRPAQDYLGRYPHQLSGGEQQRVCIARALVLDPELLVADEPTSMLDVSVRAGILNLIAHLRATLELSVLFISHDLSTIRHLCDRTAVMYRGRIVELGPTADVLREGRHPYTAALASAVPRPDPDHRRQPASAPAVAAAEPGAPEPTGGCRFAPRCPHQMNVCIRRVPPDFNVGEAHQVACHLFDPEMASEPAAVR